MSTVSSKSPVRRAARSIASSPAVAGFRPAGVALAVAAAFALQPVQANPNAGTVAFGTGTVTNVGGNTFVNITANGGTTRHSVTNWTHLGIPSGTLTKITQPDAASTSINRVNGLPTQIFGTLESNGRVVLVNPAGITMGQGAFVDTAAFTASTLDMSFEDAVAGRLRFAGGNGTLTLDGATVVKHGDVFFIGSRVETRADAAVQNLNGSIVVAAGQKVELTGRGLEGIRMEVQAPENEVVNLGRLSGDAVGVFAGTLRHSGLITAQAVSTEGGKVVLKAAGDALVSGGIVAAAGDKGGSIDVLGDRVGLMDGARLQASGRLGGGSVRVGGDYQGANANVQNASRTYVDANARIEANAFESGDGGRVIVWSEEATRMHGRIEARGGAAGGNGGFAEVSGKQYLEFTGGADLRAPAGQAGTLLLDPNDIVIEATGPTGTTQAGNVFSGGTGQTKIKASDLEAQLANSSVIVATNAGSGGTGLITIANDVNLTWTTANALGLQADGAIDLQGSINATNSGSALSLRAMNGDIIQNGSTSVIKVGALQILADTGSVYLNGTNLVDTVGGTAGGSYFGLTNGKTLTVGTASSPYGAAQSGIKSGGDVALAVTSGDLVLNQGITAGADSTVTLDVAGNVTQNTTSSVISAARMLVQSTNGSVALNGANQVGTLAAELFGAGKSFSFKNAGDLTIGAVMGPTESTVGGITAGGDITVTTSSGSIQIVDQTVESEGGRIKLDAAANITGNGTLRTRGSTTADGLGGSVTLDAAGSIAVSSIYTAATGSSELHGGNVSVTAGGAASVGWIDAYGGNSFAVGTAGGNGGTVTLKGGAGVTAGYIHTFGGSYVAGSGTAAGGKAGNVSVTATSGNIAVDWVQADGGDGHRRSATENVGQSGGNITIHAEKGDVTLLGLSALGGDTFGTQAGGAGGTITVTAANNLNLVAPYYFGDVIAADGGVSEGGGIGGQGGRIELKMGGSLLVVPDTRSPALVATDGLTTTAATTAPLALISASGGEGYDGASGTSGGQGGTIRIERTGGGPLVIDSSLMMFAMGGEGGTATSGGTGTGGVGGTGGNIDLVAAAGAVHLRSPYLIAQGGFGGDNPDGSTQAAAGALGTLRVAGTSVEVEGDMYLGAIWGNNSVVNLRDASIVAGIGRFDNFGQVVLHGTSMLAPDAGVFNNANATLASVGSDTFANLRHNSGTVDVAAGSRMKANGFATNAGTVQVNGTLEIGNFEAPVVTGPTPPPPPIEECSLCQLQAATGGTFVNEAAGTLTGTGTIVVDGGSGTIDNFGTIAPGGAGTVGTLTLSSSLIMEAGSTVATDLLSTASHDSLVVSGTARTGGTYAVTYQSGATFSAGDVFSMLQAGALDATTLPTVSAAELSASTRGSEFVLVANAPFPAVPAPPPLAPAAPAVEQVNNQVITFAHLFIQEAQMQQEEEARENQIGKDDIVVTDVACTPR